MKNALFFVTAVLTMISALACDHTQDQRQQQLKEGNSKLEEAATLESELRAFNISLVPVLGMNGRVMSVKTMAQDLNWRRFSLGERNSIKEKLSRYISLSSAVLALDAKRGIVVIYKDLVINKRDNAYEFQKSVESFEKIFGESFNPKLDGSPQPVFNQTRDI